MGRSSASGSSALYGLVATVAATGGAVVVAGMPASVGRSETGEGYRQGSGEDSPAFNFHLGDGFSAMANCSG